MKPRDRKRAVLMKKTLPAQPSGRAPAQPSQRAGRRGRLFFVAVVAAALIVATIVTATFIRHQRAHAARPVAGAGLNVLLITADTTRADFLGCYGRPNGRTPNVDRLASEGALFQRCITAATLTLPSHASLLTGNYPYVHNARTNGKGRLPEANVTLTEVLKQAGYATQATVASIVLNRQFGTAQGFDVYHDVTALAPGDPERARRKGDEIAADALGMLRALAPNPFFLWVHFYDPHAPYETTRTPPYTPAEAYEDQIAFMDEQIGRVLGELRSLGLEQRTLVVLAGDHGEGLGEHGESQHGYFLYETTLHVPLMIRCPGKIETGTSVANVVRTIDVAPTVLALLGLPALEHAQGESLLPWLSGQRGGGLYAYSETFEPHAAFGLSRLRAVTTGQWKYILAPTPELYRLPDDGAEAHSLAEQQPEVAGPMRQQLHDLIAEAPRAARDASAAAGLSDADRARLESLGYAGAQIHEDADRAELERFDPVGGNPADYAAHIDATQRAREAMNRGEYQAAEELLRPVLAALPDAPQACEVQVMALMFQRRTAEAVPVLERVLALAPSDTGLRGWYGAALNEVGHYEEAAEQFRIVLKDNAQDPRTLHNMAVSLTHLGRLAEADQHLQLALAVQPRNAHLLHTLGRLRSHQKRFAEAERCLEQALEIDPALPQCQEELQQLREAMRPHP